MWNNGTFDASFWQQLTRIDLAQAEQVRQRGCGDCGGPLDRSDYARKPRGELGQAAGDDTRRVSFCCRRDGCRHRATPPSVRFLGRKVYAGAVVIVASIVGRVACAGLRQPKRAIEGVPARTVKRWIAWWQTAFALGSFWLEAKSFFATPVEVTELPASLLSRFGDAGAATMEKLLRFISPVTTESVRTRISMAV